MNWFRVYHDIIDDPKILRLSLEDRWHYVALLAVYARCNPGVNDLKEECKPIVNDLKESRNSSVALPDRRAIAIHLRLRLDHCSRMIDRLINGGLVEEDVNTKELRIHGWEKRQFKSDNVSARTAGWRERSGERSQNGHVNVQHAQQLRNGDVTVAQQKEKESLPPDSPSFSPPTPPLLLTPLAPLKKKEKNAPAEPSLFLPPTWISLDDWDAWLEMRKQNRIKTTPRAMKIAVNKLTKLREAGQDVSAILQEAVLRNWTGVWGIDDHRKPFNGKSHDKPKIPEPNITPEMQAAAERQIEEINRAQAERLAKLHQAKASQ